MEVAIFTPVRLLAESLSACLHHNGGASIAGTAADWLELDELLARVPVCLVLVDVTQGINFEAIHACVAKWPQNLFIALGLREHREEVVRSARAGFVAYIPRDASLRQLHQAIIDAIEGRLVCSQEIAGELMRALYRVGSTPESGAEGLSAEDLTRREIEVASLVSRGCSNKEIARELSVSVATVKHHVHNILGKLQVSTRSRVGCAMRHGGLLGSADVFLKATASELLLPP
jgi:two-component system, NarL family, nitrate/nitrite response regulator NarL